MLGTSVLAKALFTFGFSKYLPNDWVFRIIGSGKQYDVINEMITKIIYQIFIYHHLLVKISL